MRHIAFVLAVLSLTATVNAQISHVQGWHKISYSELSGTDNTSPCPANGYGGYGYAFLTNCPNVYNAWSGACPDIKRDRLIIWGGGHTDYSGNEVYAVELDRIGTATSSAPAIVRFNNPSQPNASGSADTGVDGLPVSRHTYDGEVCIPATDQMLNVGGSNAPGGGGAQTTWTLQLANLADSCAISLGGSGCNPGWVNRGNVTAGSGPGEQYAADYDSANFVVQLIDNQYNIEAYNLTAGTWSNEGTGLSIAGFNGGSTYDDHDQIEVYMGCYSSCSMFYVSTLAGSSYAQVNVTLSGCGAFPVGQPEMRYDPLAHAIRLLTSGSNVIYMLHPSLTSTTWTCTTETYGSTSGVDYPPANAASLQMISGKFAYFNELDIFVLCNDPANDCWYLVPRR